MRNLINSRRKHFTLLLGMIRLLLKYYLEGLLSLLIVSWVLIIFGQVIFRYVFRAPPFWTEELARYIFTWVCFLGAAYVLKNKGNITLSFIYKYIPQHFLFYYKQLINILILFTIVILVYYGIKSCINIYGIVSPALGINMVYVNAALPVSGIIMLCYQLYFIKKG